MSSREQVDAEPRGLPSTLSILPLKDRILLPSSAMKLVLTTPSALALVDDILGAAYVKPGTLYAAWCPCGETRLPPRGASRAARRSSTRSRSTRRTTRTTSARTCTTSGPRRGSSRSREATARG